MNFFRGSRRFALIVGLIAACIPGNTVSRSPLIRRFRVTSRGSGPRAHRRSALRLMATLANGVLVFGAFTRGEQLRDADVRDPSHQVWADDN
jgi:hypothetical protein